MAHFDNLEEEQQHIREQIPSYLGVGGVLIVGTLLTVYLPVLIESIFHIPLWAKFLIGGIIAVIKAGFVAAIFMHLINESKTIYRILIFTCLFAAGMMILMVWTHKNPIVMPVQW